MPSPLLLASSSPRRKQLLEQIGFRVRVRAAEVDERPRAGEGPEAYATRLAGDKARAAARLEEGGGPRWVLAADTVVVIDGELLGKPADLGQAREMLGRLSGRGHRVITGFGLLDTRADRLERRATHTAVRFKGLSEAEITAYLRTGESLDKAGAYGIQGRAAYMVQGVEGSYTNVVGLPLCEVVALMDEMGADEVLPWA